MIELEVLVANSPERHSVNFMDHLEHSQCSAEVAAKADRVKRTILWVMGILILLPFLLVWLTGAIQF